MIAIRICCAVLAIIAGLAQIALASLQLAFPINSQVPPVAYVAENYDFVFASTTFDNDGSDITYSLVGNPSWLQIESSSRRLTGTPSASDAGAPTFSLVATDQTGQKSSSVTLVVLRNTAITLGADILPQLEAQGNVTSSASLLYRPLQAFSFTFSHDTFVGTSSQTNYYATSIGGSPLPSWIQFDAATLQFRGNAPPLLQPPPALQQYSFSLAASNVVGFSEVHITFSIIIGDHLLAFNPPSISVNATAGYVLQIAALLPFLLLDGEPVARGDPISVTSTAPDWLTLDTTNISLFGMPPVNAVSGSFFILAGSQTSNVANMTVSYEILPALSSGRIQLGSFSASPGMEVDHQIQLPSVLNSTHASSASLGALSSWLTFIPSNLTLHGHIPSDMRLAQYPISISFSQSSGTTIVGNLTLDVVAKGDVLSPSSTTGNPSSATSSSVTIGGSGLSGLKSRTTTLVLAIIVPIVGVLIVICLGLLCLQLRAMKRQKAQLFAGTDMTPPPSAQMLLGRFHETLPPSVVSRPQTSHSSRYNGPPRLELPWAPDSIRGARKRLSKRPKTSHSSDIGASWDDLIGHPMPLIQSHAASPLPWPIREPAPALVADYSKPFSRPSPTVRRKKSGQLHRKLTRDTFQSRISQTPRISAGNTIGLPKRASGAGHGTMIANSTFNPQRSSWQTTFGTILQLESRPNTILLESFPAPPPNSALNKASQIEAEPKLTLRVVSPEGNHYEGDIEAARQTHTQQARKQLEGINQPSQSAVPTLDEYGSVAPAGEDVRPPSPPVRIRPTLSINTPAGFNHLNAPAGLSPRQLTPTSLSNYSHSPTTSPVMSSGALNSFTFPPQSPFQPTTSSPNPQQYQHQPTSTSFSRSLHRLTSAASSRQFDSAISSDSQWEDDEPIVDEAERQPATNESRQLHTQPQSQQLQHQLHHQQSQPQPRNQEDRRPSSASIILHSNHQDPRHHPKYQSLTLPPHNLILPSPPTPIALLFSRPTFHLNPFIAKPKPNINLTNTILTPVSPTTAVNTSHARASVSANVNVTRSAGPAVAGRGPSFDIYEDAPIDPHDYHDYPISPGRGSRSRSRGRQREDDYHNTNTNTKSNTSASVSVSRSISQSRRKRVLTGMSAASATGGASGGMGMVVPAGGDESSDDDDGRGSYRFL